MMLISKAKKTLWLGTHFILLLTVLSNGELRASSVAEECEKASASNAFAACDRAIQADPLNATAFFKRGEALLVRGDVDRAISDLTRAISINSKWGAPFILRGNAWSSKQDARAIEDYRAAINLNPKSSANYNLALIYHEGFIVKKDYKKAIELYLVSANDGVVEAQHNLGLLYSEENSEFKNYKFAAAWFRKAAELGYMEAQVELASLYLSGLGANVDVAEAEKWFLIAFQKGSPYAAYNLGLLYSGDFDKKFRNLDKAISFFKFAVDKHIAEAQQALEKALREKASR